MAPRAAGEGRRLLGRRWRGHAISGRESNLFKPLRQHFQPTRLHLIPILAACRGSQAPLRLPRGGGSRDRSFLFLQTRVQSAPAARFWPEKRRKSPPKPFHFWRRIGTYQRVTDDKAGKIIFCPLPPHERRPHPGILRAGLAERPDRWAASGDQRDGRFDGNGHSCLPLQDDGNKCGTVSRLCQENVVHLAIVVNERLARFCRRPICPMYPRRRRLLGKATLEAPGSSRHFQCRDGVDLLSQLLLYSHAAGGHQGHDGAAGEEARSLKREGRVNGHGRGGERTLWRQKVTVSRTVKTVVRSDAT